MSTHINNATPQTDPTLERPIMTGTNRSVSVRVALHGFAAHNSPVLQPWNVLEMTLTKFAQLVGTDPGSTADGGVTTPVTRAAKVIGVAALAAQRWSLTQHTAVIKDIMRQDRLGESVRDALSGLGGGLEADPEFMRLLIMNAHLGDTVTRASTLLQLGSLPQLLDQVSATNGITINPLTALSEVSAMGQLLQTQALATLLTRVTNLLSGVAVGSDADASQQMAARLHVFGILGAAFLGLALVPHVYQWHYATSLLESPELFSVYYRRARLSAPPPTLVSSVIDNVDVYGVRNAYPVVLKRSVDHLGKKVQALDLPLGFYRSLLEAYNASAIAMAGDGTAEPPTTEVNPVGARALIAPWQRQLTDGPWGSIATGVVMPGEQSRAAMLREVLGSFSYDTWTSGTMASLYAMLTEMQDEAANVIAQHPLLRIAGIIDDNAGSAAQMKAVRQTLSLTSYTVEAACSSSPDLAPTEVSLTGTAMGADVLLHELPYINPIPATRDTFDPGRIADKEVRYYTELPSRLASLGMPANAPIPLLVKRHPYLEPLLRRALNVQQRGLLPANLFYTPDEARGVGGTTFRDLAMAMGLPEPEARSYFATMLGGSAGSATKNAIATYLMGIGVLVRARGSEIEDIIDGLVDPEAFARRGSSVYDRLVKPYPNWSYGYDHQQVTVRTAFEEPTDRPSAIALTRKGDRPADETYYLILYPRVPVPPAIDGGGWAWTNVLAGPGAITVAPKFAGPPPEDPSEWIKCDGIAGLDATILPMLDLVSIRSGLSAHGGVVIRVDELAYLDSVSYVPQRVEPINGIVHTDPDPTIVKYGGGFGEALGPNISVDRSVIPSGTFTTDSVSSV